MDASARRLPGRRPYLRSPARPSLLAPLPSRAFGLDGGDQAGEALARRAHFVDQSCELVFVVALRRPHLATGGDVSGHEPSGGRREAAFRGPIRAQHTRGHMSCGHQASRRVPRNRIRAAPSASLGSGAREQRTGAGLDGGDWWDTQCRRRTEMAEREGFEPPCRLPGKTLSRRPRYDHFGTSPRLTPLVTDDRSRPPRLEERLHHRAALGLEHAACRGEPMIQRRVLVRPHC